METKERIKILNQILWDYTISVEDVDAVLRGDIKQAGHYNQEMIFFEDTGIILLVHYSSII